jgi:hypothetical protein
LDDHINQSADLFKIQDLGDYEREYNIKDRTKDLAQYINYSSIIGARNFLYNETSYANYKDLTRYARERAKQTIDLINKNIEDLKELGAFQLGDKLECDFEWADILLEPEKNINKRLRSLRFDDMINIVSGKLSDFELHDIIHDNRPIKTTEEMNQFLTSMVIDLESKKTKFQIEKRRRESKDEKMKKKFKKGFGSMLLMELNKKSQEENIFNMEGKVDLKKYQNVFNQFLLNNNMKPKKSSESSGNTSAREKSLGHNLTARDFGTSNEMVEEIIVDIDERIDQKMRNLVNLTKEKPEALQGLI